MKLNKIIILVLYIFLFSSCKIKEIEDYLLISGIGIDYSNESFIVTLEVYEDSNGEATDVKTYCISGKGRKIGLAFKDIYQKTDKDIFLNHCRICILGENILKEKLEETFDFIIADATIRSTIYFTVAKGCDASNIYNNQDICISENILNKINKAKNYGGIYTKCAYNDVMNTVLSNRVDLVLPTISVDNDIVFNGGVLIKNKKYVKHLSKEEIFVIQLLTSTIKSHIDTLGDVGYSITKSKSKLKIKNKKTLLYDLNIEISVFIDDTSNFDNMSYESKFLKSLKEDLSKRITNVFNDFISNTLDPFGIINEYYRKKPMIYRLYENDLTQLYQGIMLINKINIKIISIGMSDSGVEER